MTFSVPIPGFRKARKPLALIVLVSLFAVWIGPVAAEPPSWAPAHGYRAKYKTKSWPKPYINLERHSVLALGRCNRDVLGGLLGGTAGAAIGSTVDRGDGRAAAIVGGAIIGVLVGGAIGHYMDSVDQNCVGQTLEHVPSGQTIAWRNDQSGEIYRVTPSDTFQTGDGRTCRRYTTEALIDGQQQQIHGTACRQPDGAWKLGG
jgi:surface antigen